MTKRQLEETVRRMIAEETNSDYQYLNSAYDAVDWAHLIIMKFNNTTKNTSLHAEDRAVKEKMFKLEELLKKYKSEISKIL